MILRYSSVISQNDQRGGARRNGECDGKPIGLVQRGIQQSIGGMERKDCRLISLPFLDDSPAGTRNPVASACDDGNSRTARCLGRALAIGRGRIAPEFDESNRPGDRLYRLLTKYKFLLPPAKNSSLPLNGVNASRSAL
jgi:hypothetical protein